MPHGSGIDVLRASKAAAADVPVILMTAYGSIDEAVQAMKEGAHDFLQKPVDSNHLLLLVERALEHIDRKSTRLNSSHANISYAVFCLKKKYNVTLLPTH